jgi:uncharacterized protein YdaU (DUF1376 family)
MKKPAVWFRLIIGDHFRRVSGLTRLQRGALNDLIVNYFSKGSLPTDERVLARLCEMSRKEWFENRDAIKEAGNFMDDWRADWIEAELKDVENRREQTAHARAKWAEKRAAQPPQPEHNLPEKTDPVTPLQSQSPSPSHSPFKKEGYQEGTDLYPGRASPLDVERYINGEGSTREKRNGSRSEAEVLLKHPDGYEWNDDD